MIIKYYNKLRNIVKINQYISKIKIKKFLKKQLTINLYSTLKLKKI